MTVFVAAAVFFAAALARWFLERSSRSDTVHLRGRVELTAVWNEGAAFSLPISRGILRMLSAAALGMAWMQRRYSALGAGLILGGGGANLYERLRYGKVYDYVRFPNAPGRWKNYVCNLADIAIFLGALMLLLRGMQQRRKEKNSQFRH